MEVQVHGGIVMQGAGVKDFRFADDIDLLAEKEDHLLAQLTEVYQASEAFGLHINKGKTKVMVMGNTNTGHIYLNSEELEYINQFVYLGSLISRNNDCSKEIQRIGIANSAFASLATIWKTVMLGRLGVRKRGRQKRRWIDDITDWTGLNIQQAFHMAEERKGIGAKKSYHHWPQQSIRLWVQ